MFISHLFWLGKGWRERFSPRLHASSLGNTVGSMMNFRSMKGKAKPYQVRQLLDAIDGLNHG